MKFKKKSFTTTKQYFSFPLSLPGEELGVASSPRDVERVGLLLYGFFPCKVAHMCTAQTSGNTELAGSSTTC